ncbi:uncharacterized protein [Diadema setosum]|uniref:uncharacterized protein n=1 Tax=Diadema setosum TaxID=31175 RepID=UPI003B3AC2DA
MAMLAEPRRRQKLSFDPRNKAWSDDSSKFGQKLMEKMGWSKGKGLGVKEDGQLSHIKVSLKNNTLGVGCKASQEDNWIAHQDDFNDLLSSLNQNHGGSIADGNPSQSLEERSKKSRSRVHYKKFTRGKDLTKYGKEGMNSILGRRLTQSAPVTPQSQSVENSDQEGENEKEEVKEKGSEEGTEEVSHGVVTIKGSCSVGEYFAQKMAALKRARHRVESESHSDTEVDPPRGGFGFRPAAAAEADNSHVAAPEDRAGPSGLGRQAGSTQRMGCVAVADREDGNDDREDGGGENEGEEEREMESEEGMDGHRDRSGGKKKKKRKKKRMRNAERDSDDNDAVIEVRGQSENEEDEGIEIDRKKKKNKKKKRLMDEVTVESKSESASEQNGGDDCERKRKKKTKKSKKDKNRNEVAAEHSCSIDDDTSEERSGGETSRKRKCDSHEESVEDEVDETTSSRKKRKKDKGEKSETQDGGESSISKKKKKKKQKM